MWSCKKNPPVIIILSILLRNYIEYISDPNYVFLKDEYDRGKSFKLNYIIIYKYYLSIYISILTNSKTKLGKNDQWLENYTPFGPRFYGRKLIMKKKESLSKTEDTIALKQTSILKSLKRFNYFMYNWIIVLIKV